MIRSNEHPRYLANYSINVSGPLLKEGRNIIDTYVATNLTDQARLRSYWSPVSATNPSRYHSVSKQ